MKLEIECVVIDLVDVFYEKKIGKHDYLNADQVIFNFSSVSRFI